MYKTNWVQTEFGLIEVTATDGTHVHVCAGSSGQHYARFRNEDYYVSLHLGLYGGVWSLLRDKLGNEQSTYVTRKSQPAPPSYHKKIVEGLVAEVTLWLEANPNTLEMAEQAHLEHEYEKAENEEKAARAALTEANEKATAAFVKLNKFRASLKKR